MGPIKVYESDLSWQRGRGLGSIFAGVFKGLVPLVRSALKIGKSALKSPAAKRLLKDVKKEALRAGINVSSDVLAGENLGKSAQKNLVRVKKRVISSAKKNIAKPFLKEKLNIDFNGKSKRRRRRTQKKYTRPKRGRRRANRITSYSRSGDDIFD